MNKIIKEDIIEIISEIPGDKFLNKTVLITGANGFLASYLTFYFLFLNKRKKQKTKIIAIVRDLKKAKIKFKDFLDNDFFELTQHDVNNYFNYKGSINFIFHAASQASPKYYKIDPIGTTKPNILGTYNLLNLSVKKTPECFLFFSSGEVYGNTESISINETDYGVIDPISVRSCYGESKKMAENICVGYNVQKDINIKIVRPFHIYGPGMELNDGRVQADFIKNILKKENLKITSDGKAVRSFCYIKDATKAFLLIALNGKCAYPYNVGNPSEIYDVESLAHFLTKNCCDYDAKVIFENGSDNYLKSSFSLHAPEISRIKKIGWEPQTNIKEGFSKSIKSYD